MNKKITLLGLVVAFAAVFNIANAATVSQRSSPLTSPGEVIQTSSFIPKVYVSNLKFTVNENRNIAGSYTIRNSEETAIGDLHYEIQILSPAPELKLGKTIIDAPVVYDRLVSEESFGLAPMESLEKNFSYKMPPVVKGDYRLRLRAVTSNSRSMGWTDEVLKVSTDGVYPIVAVKEVDIKSADPMTQKSRDVWGPMEGVNIKPDQQFSIKLNIKNAAAKGLNGKLVVFARRDLISNSKAERTEIKDIAIKAKADENLNVTLTAANIPGAYGANIAVYNEQGERISSPGEFRYVVEGDSASVVSAKIEGVKDDVLSLNFAIVGRSDRQSTADGVPGRLEVSASDNDKECGKESGAVNLSVGAVMGKATVLIKDCPAISRINLKIYSDKGDLLDDYGIDYQFKKAVKENSNPGVTSEKKTGVFENKNMLLALVVIIVLAISVSLAVFVFFKKRKSKIPYIVNLIFLVLLSSALIGHQDVRAGIQTETTGYSGDYQEAIFTVFVNSPQNGGTYFYGSIPYTIHMDWTACGNSTTYYSTDAYIAGQSVYSNSSTQKGVGDSVWYSHVADYSTLLPFVGPYSGNQTTLLSKFFYKESNPCGAGCRAWATWKNVEDTTIVKFNPIPISCSFPLESNVGKLYGGQMRTVNGFGAPVGAVYDWSLASPPPDNNFTLDYSQDPVNKSMPRFIPQKFSVPTSKTYVLNVSTAFGNGSCSVVAYANPTVSCSSDLTNIDAGQPAQLSVSAGSMSLSDLRFGWKIYDAGGSEVPTSAYSVSYPNPGSKDKLKFTPTSASTEPVTYTIKVKENPYSWQGEGLTVDEGTCTVKVNGTGDPLSCVPADSNVKTGASTALTATGGLPGATLSWTSIEDTNFGTHNGVEVIFNVPKKPRDYKYKVTDGIDSKECTVHVFSSQTLPTYKEL